MRLFFVLSEGHFYQPDFVADFLRKTEDKVVGAALVTKAPKKNDLEAYLIRNIYRLHFQEIFKLAFQTLKALIFDKFFPKKKDKPFYSVKSVLETFDIPYFQVEYDINKPEYLKKIKKRKPDIIVSSNPLFFKKEILKLPRICCLNRHSALLPSFGGVWPVFHAFKAGKKYTGVSVHTMVSKIDQGIVLAQNKVRIKKGDTLAELYDQTYKLSAKTLLEALKKVSNNNFTPVKKTPPASYFSFPTNEDWRLFRSRGGKFI